MATDTAYLRDASWRNHPSTSGAKQFHLASARDPGLTACGAGVINDQGAQPAAAVPDHSRCQRNGCRQLWPAPTPTAEETP